MWLFGNVFAQSSRQQIHFHAFLEEIMHLKRFTISDKPVKILPQPPDGRFNVTWTFVWSLTQRLGLSFQLNHLPGHSAFLKSSWNQLHRHISCILGLLSWSWATCVFQNLFQLQLDHELTWLHQVKALSGCKSPKFNWLLSLWRQHHRIYYWSQNTGVKESPLATSPVFSSFCSSPFSFCILHYPFFTLLLWVRWDWDYECVCSTQ